MITPITPDEVYENKDKFVHPSIIEIINQLLGERYTKGRSAVILQKELVIKFLEKNPDFTEQKMINDGILDFEDAYRKIGWSVEYDKATLYGGENYFDPFFKFTANKK